MSVTSVMTVIFVMSETVMNIIVNYVLVSRDTVIMLNKKPLPSSFRTNLISLLCFPTRKSGSG
jgi:hypothetical protein